MGWIKSMTPVERHAELVYAESLFEKVRVSSSLAHASLIPPQGYPRHCLLRGLAGVHQGSVSSRTPTQFPLSANP